MTGMKKKISARYGTFYRFNLPYLENRWIRFVFRLLVSSLAALILMSGIAGEIGKLRESVLDERRNALSEEIDRWGQQAETQRARLSLTGEKAALEEKLVLIREKAALEATLEAKEPIAEAPILSRLETLETEIEESYLRGCGTADPITAALSFSRIFGYKESDRWYRLSMIRAERKTEKARLQGRRLTAWVLSYRLMTGKNPRKNPGKSIPLSFAPLTGSWLCREDQLAALDEDSAQGDGRAGSQAGGQAGIRLITAEGNALYGEEITGLDDSKSDPDARTLLVKGGIGSLTADPEAIENEDDACCVLHLDSVKPSEEELPVEKLRVISENVFRIETGEWKGTYYRIL